MYEFHSFTRDSECGSDRGNEKKRGKCERERGEIYFISVSVSFKCEHFLISHPVKGCQRHIFSVWLKFWSKCVRISVIPSTARESKILPLTMKNTAQINEKQNTHTETPKKSERKRRENWNCEMTKAELWEEIHKCLRNGYNFRLI